MDNNSYVGFFGVLWAKKAKRGREERILQQGRSPVTRVILLLLSCSSIVLRYMADGSAPPVENMDSPSADKYSLAVERFGPIVERFGPLICSAVDRHLQRTGGHTLPPEEKQVAEPPSAASLATPLRFNIDDVTPERREKLRARMDDSGKQGACFSVSGQMEAITSRCGGRLQLDEAIFDLIEHVHSTVEGGLASNWFQIGFGSDGVLGIQCVTCNNGRTLAFANSGQRTTGPFNNFKGIHLKGKVHEGARARAAAEIEQHLVSRVTNAAARGELLPAASVPRLAMQLACDLFATRAAGQSGFAAPPAAPADLTPIGSEPCGPMTRSTWEALQPKLPETAQNQLDARIERGAYTVQLDETLGEVAACQRALPAPLPAAHPLVES